MAFSRKTPTLCERDTRQLWGTNLIHPLERHQVFHIYLWWEQVCNYMINRVGKMCVAAMSLCMIILIVTRKRGDGRYYFPLWQTNNNTPNKLRMSRYILNEVETSHHLILIRLYFILTILITEDDHNHIVFEWIKIIAV
jgi:hypothetical protein